mmetsp:Transcript_122105/g.390523  ORF Transcript_122105/g.390523 Transcript_122105/m.390523 type:complete len:557 (+) Transcript_122105:135-1805(+)
MEVQVDAFGDAPPDTFLALRIGDVQKQSRFSDSRTFKFPKGAPNGFNFGRVEVFKRIGHLTVRLDDLEGGAKDVEVPCDYPGTRQVSMRLAVRGGQLDHLPGLDAKSGAKFKQRQDTAQRYLEEHKLEELLADAMKHLIHKKPHNPHQFLSKFILQRSSTPPLPSIYQASGPPQLAPELPLLQLKQPRLRPNLLGEAKLPPLAACPSAPALGLPGKLFVPKVVQPLLAHFSGYYRENFRSVGPEELQDLYAKFPAARQVQFNNSSKQAGWTDFRDYFTENFIGAPAPCWNSIHAKFPPAPKVQFPTPQASVAKVGDDFGRFYAAYFAGGGNDALQSVYMKFPAYCKALEIAVQDVQIERLPLRGAGFNTLPSVGSWLARKPKIVQGPSQVVAGQCTGDARPSLPSLSDFGAYAKEYLVPCGMMALYSKFPPVRARAVTATNTDAGPSSITSHGFRHKASVGTWLMVRPPRCSQTVTQLTSAHELAKLPSVGTWLTLRPSGDASAKVSPTRSLLDVGETELEGTGGREWLLAAQNELAAKDKEIEELRRMLERMKPA